MSTEAGEDLRGLRTGIFACLSGGGFRASLFQLGALKRLHEVGLLGHVYAYSATSGGAYVAACMAVAEEKYGPDWAEVESTVLRMASTGVVGPAVLSAIAFGLYALAYFAALAHVFHVSWALPVALLALGIVAHVTVLCRLVFAKAHNFESVDVEWRRMSGLERPPYRLTGLRHLLRMMLSPSYLRCQMLNAIAFRGRVLRHVATLPALFITAVDLNDGVEKVFSPPGVLGTLDAGGCTALWKQRVDVSGIDVQDLELAEVVAASSAIPPLFHPVTLRSEAGEIGTFVDGGITDNLAMNPVKAFAGTIHAGRIRFVDDNFVDRTRLVLAIDGSSPIQVKRRAWSRLSFGRVIDAMSNQANLDSEDAARNLERNVGIPARILSLKHGFMGDEMSCAPAMNEALRRVRTHLDGFSPEECAVLMFCGYRQAELLVRENAKEVARLSRFKYVPPTSIAEMLPEPYKKISGDWSSLLSHLAASDARLALWRWIRRMRVF